MELVGSHTLLNWAKNPVTPSAGPTMVPNFKAPEPNPAINHLLSWLMGISSRISRENCTSQLLTIRLLDIEPKDMMDPPTTHPPWTPIPGPKISAMIDLL
jgi:hypothetical protein